MPHLIARRRVTHSISQSSLSRRSVTPILNRLITPTLHTEAVHKFSSRGGARLHARPSSPIGRSHLCAKEERCMSRAREHSESGKLWQARRMEGNDQNVAQVRIGRLRVECNNRVDPRPSRIFPVKPSIWLPRIQSLFPCHLLTLCKANTRSRQMAADAKGMLPNVAQAPDGEDYTTRQWAALSQRDEMHTRRRLSKRSYLRKQDKLSEFTRGTAAWQEVQFASELHFKPSPCR